jgi:hypothetical protein
MQVATIAPVYDLDLCDSFSHFYMVLQWLCVEDPQYKSHFINVKRRYQDVYIVLDNGMNEQRLCTDQALLETARDINANEIICPDVFLDAEQTIKKTTAFLDKYYESHIKGKFNTMAVLQGDDEESFLKCYDAFLNDDRINFLGIGYRNLMKPFKGKIEDFEFDGLNKQELKDVLINDCYYYTLSRLYFLKNVLDFKKLEEKDKSLHLLGSYNPYEMKFFKEPLFTAQELLYIRSWDSACCIQAAQAGVTFNENYGVKDKPKAILNFEDHLDGNTRRLAQKNIKILKGWLLNEKE